MRVTRLSPAFRVRVWLRETTTNVGSKMSEFLPLRKKLKRVGTGEEENFVPSYLPETLAAASDSRAREKVEYRQYTCMNSALVQRMRSGHVACFMVT